MLYRIAVFVIGVFLVTIVAQPALAAGRAGNFGLEETAKSSNYKDDAGSADIFGTVQRVVSVLLALLGIIFFVLTTYAGVRWMTSRGNEEIALEAKNTLESAVIGLVVVVASYGITNFIFSKLEQSQVEQSQNQNFNLPPCKDSPVTASNGCTGKSLGEACIHSSLGTTGVCQASETDPESCICPL